MQFEVKFYDGLNSKSNPAVLFIKKNIWKIEYKDSDGNIIHAFWEPYLVKPIELAGEVITLSYGSFPPASIECANTILNHLPKVKGWGSVSSALFDYIREKGSKAVVSLAAALLLLIAFIYFVILPFSAGIIAASISDTYEQKLGYYITDQFLRGETVNQDLSEALNEFSSQINYDMENSPRIIAVESNLVNAFALPGGYIVVFEGILKSIQNENQLAALLCHEAAHIKYRHSLKSMFRNLGGYLFIAWLFSDLNAVTAIIIENAHTLHTLSYSRSIEYEADEKGLEILKNNNISQQGMVELLQLLKREENMSRAKLNFLSTHPLTENRIEYSSSIAGKQHEIVEYPVLREKWNDIQELLSQTD